MEHYQTIIVGAGPAGLSCAQELGQYQKILLIDKEKFPGDKVCAGGITHLNHGLLELPNKVCLSFNKHIITINETDIKVTLEHPIITVDRKKLAKYQFKQIAGNSNIIYLPETRLIKIVKDKIITSKGDFYFSNLIGADGSNSLVRQHLGLKNKLIIGLQYRLPKKKTYYIRWVFNPKVLQLGYAWIFPHYDYVAVGCVFNPLKVKATDAKNFLVLLIKKHGLKINNEPLQSAPINYYFKGWQFDNKFLIGDAAGLPSALTGEGISFAIISGLEIAKHIVNRNYQLYELKKIISIKKRQEKCLNFLSRLSHPNIQSAILIPFAIGLNSKHLKKVLFGY